MIDDVLRILNELLSDFLAAGAGEDPTPGKPKVVFPDGQQMDPIHFPLDAVSTLLIHLEQQNVPRAADPYRRAVSGGGVQRVDPMIRLNLYVLFVAHFKRYDQSLLYLSRIIQFFQSHRVLDPENTPAMRGKLEKLIIELQSPSLEEQNEIWNALRTAYNPSVLYKISQVFFDGDGAPLALVGETSVDASQLPGPGP